MTDLVRSTYSRATRIKLLLVVVCGVGFVPSKTLGQELPMAVGEPSNNRSATVGAAERSPTQMRGTVRLSNRLFVPPGVADVAVGRGLEWLVGSGYQGLFSRGLQYRAPDNRLLGDAHAGAIETIIFLDTGRALLNGYIGASTGSSTVDLSGNSLDHGNGLNQLWGGLRFQYRFPLDASQRFYFGTGFDIRGQHAPQGRGLPRFANVELPVVLFGLIHRVPNPDQALGNRCVLQIFARSALVLYSSRNDTDTGSPEVGLRDDAFLDGLGGASAGAQGVLNCSSVRVSFDYNHFFSFRSEQFTHSDEARVQVRQLWSVPHTNSSWSLGYFARGGLQSWYGLDQGNPNQSVLASMLWEFFAGAIVQYNPRVRVAR